MPDLQTNIQLLLDVSRALTHGDANDPLAQVIAAAPTPFALADLNGLTTYANRAFADTFGFARAMDCVGIPTVDFYADPVAVADAAARVARGEHPRGAPLRLMAKRRDGSLFEVDVFPTTITDAAGTPIALGGTVLDVSGRLRTERELAARESSLRRTGRIAHIGGWELDLVAGRPIWDDEVRRIHDLPLDYEPTLESAISFYRAPADAKITELVQRLVEERTPFDAILPLRTALGRDIWVRSQGEAIVEDGRVVRVVGTFQDVTEQQDAALKLAAEEARSRAIVDGSLDMILLLDADGAITFESPAVARVLGYAPNALCGSRLLEWVHPDDFDAVRETFERLLADPAGTVTTTFRHRHQDGSWRRVETTVRNLLEVPGVQAILAMARDITERELLEARLHETQKLEGIGRLAGGIAHDFNNLLTAILGYAEELMVELPPGRSQDDMAQIVAAGQRAKGLTGQLLAFARRTMVQPRVFDPGQRVSESLRMLERMLGEDVALRVLAPPDLPHVQMDPAQFDQIVVNLAVNARDAMPEGGRLDVRLSHRTSRSAGTSGSFGRSGDVGDVELLVRDSGIGMSPEVVAQVFEPFFTTKEMGRGTGMGLATVYGIVQQAGGAISVESVPGHGTSFRVILPGVPAVATTAEVPEPVRDIPGRGQRVWLVEDDDSVREIAHRFLREAGFSVTVARSGMEALRAMQTSPAPDVVITDVVMPAMNGRELAGRLKEKWPHVPVAYVSGYPQDRLRTADGELPFLTKPFTRRELLDLVERCLTDAAVGVQASA